MRGGILVVAAEGALQYNLYPKKLSKYSIECVSVTEEYYKDIRYFIECVKRNSISREDGIRSKIFLEQFGVTDVLLGCTEFPVFIKYFEDCSLFNKYTFYDPLQLAIDKIRKEIS